MSIFHSKSHRPPILHRAAAAVAIQAALFLASRLSVQRKASLFFALQKQLRLNSSLRLFREAPTVRCGLFSGMLIPQESIMHQNFSLAHVLGTFEPCVQHTLAKATCQRFVAIGCGCGFYSVGMAYRFHIPAIGYDIDTKQLALANSLSDLNGLSHLCKHVEVAPTFDFGEVIRQGDLVLIDIDGGEIDLFERLLKSKLPSASFLVECHRIGSRNAREVAELIASRCAHSHSAFFLDESEPPNLTDVEQANCVQRNEAIFFAREQRKNFQWWLFLQPRSLEQNSLESRRGRVRPDSANSQEWRGS